MLKIIKDFDNVLDLKNVIKVVDNNSFIESRTYIVELKNENFKKDAKIIVKNPKYEFGYIDLEEIEGFVQIEEIDLVKVLEERLDIKLFGISRQEILLTNINKKLELFVNSYNYNYSFSENIIMFNLGTENLEFLNDIDSFISFILAKIDIILMMKEEKNKTLEYLKILGKNISNRKDFLWFLDILDYETNFEDFIKVIIYNELFKGYTEFDKETIGKPERYIDIKFELPDKIFNDILCSSIEFLEKLDLELFRKEKQLYLFSSLNEDNFGKIVEKATGVLKYEFQFLLEYVMNKILEANLENIEQLELYIYTIENKFQKLLKISNKSKETISTLKNFINKIKILVKMEKEMSNLDSINKWAEFYIDRYMKVKNDLDKENNIYCIIDKIFEDMEAKKKMIKNVSSIIENINLEYEKFLYSNFEEIHREDKGKFSISTALYKLSYYSNEKIVFLVIDAMRWDIWEITKRILEEHEYSQVNQDNFLISMIPTVTNISRLSLFAGNKYKTIMEEKLKNKYKFDYREEANHFKRFFKGKNVGFVIGGKEKFNQLINKDLDIYVFVYSESDAILHGLTDINSEIVYYVLKEQLDNIIEKIESRFQDKVRIIITTDHGTIDVKNSEGVYLKSSFKDYLMKHSIEYTCHGKYIRLFSKNCLNSNIYNEIHEYLKSQNYFYILDRDNMDRFLLPKKEVDGYNLFYLICKYNYHISGTAGSNTHGGFSLNETIVPFGVFQKELSEMKELDINVLSKLVYGTRSKLMVQIINPNDFDIEKIHIAIEPFVYDYVVDSIEGKSCEEFEICIIPNKYGLVTTYVNIKFEKFGNMFEFSKELSLKVKEDLKTRISKDVNRSRRLDF